MCTPSRAAPMTGRDPHRDGLQTIIIPSAGKYGLATDEWLLPLARSVLAACRGSITAWATYAAR